ncbi:MAG: DUF2271 domain-containing protein [Desulfobacterales bacterium]|nr:DUF2271 domain-containing protein [Desulfobacterales bacterium]
MKKFIVVFLFVLLGYHDPVFAQNEQMGTVIITFDFNRAKQDYANNQFAVWIEDLDGKLVKTIFETNFTARGGWQYRPESLPAWTQKSNISKLTETEVDAISGATPKSQRLVYKWRGDDSEHNFLPAGQYKYFIEVNYYWDSAAVFSGIIEIGDSANSTTAKATYSIKDVKNYDLIENVAAEYIPLQ